MSVKSLQDAMQNGTLSSVQLVQRSLHQIDRFDGTLNAVAELNKDALKLAQASDEKRTLQGASSSLHGIPVLLKDNINTTDGLLTTAGSLALMDNHAPYEATLVTHLKAAGAIILGKTNLSEFAYFMHQKDMPSGYSSRSGQVVNPFGASLDPLGSSTGSAVAVAAGYTPLAVGTETSGSLMAPSYHTSTVSIKPTVGVISRTGIIPISPVQDTAGPMGLSVEDCAMMLEALKGYDPADDASVKTDQVNYEAALNRSLDGLTLGLLIDHVLSPLENQCVEALKKTYANTGVTIKEIPFTPHELPVYDALKIEFKEALNAYLKSVQPIQMTTLKDIIAFNRAHEATCLKYGQSILEAAEAIPYGCEDPAYQTIRHTVTQAANVFAKLYQTHHLDAMVSLNWNAYGPALGHPSIVVPAKDLGDLTPKSFVFMGPSFSDETLIALAHHYDRLTHAFKPPRLSE